MTTYANAFKILLIIYFSLLIIEWIVSILMKKKVYNPMDAISGMSSGITNNTKALLKLTIVIMSYEWMFDHLSLFEMKVSPWAYILAFVGFDFAYYWRHRWAHEINFLWNRHLIHHSSEEFNLSAGMRQPISGFIELYFFLYIPIAMLGVPTMVVAVIAPLHRFAQFWYHTRLITRMGILEKIIVTPAHHRVHHAINAEYIDKNYSAIFIIWDKLFGTFQEETLDNPPVYGIKKAAQSWNPFLINFMHITQLIKDTWNTKKITDKIKIWYKKTGWRPADVTEKYPVTYVEDAKTQIKYRTETTPFLITWFFIQVILHIAIQFHFLQILPVMDYSGLLLYGLVFGISVFAYTSLMDRSWIALPFEIVKCTIGFWILYNTSDWFTLNETFGMSTIVVAIYFLISLAVTAKFHPRHKSKRHIVTS